MFDASRRDLLRNAAIAALAGGLPGADAQHVHKMAAADKAAAAGPYQPKAFTPHEFATLQKLADLILPPDEQGPGAAEAGAPDFIDLLSSQNPQLAAIYTGGIGWMDSQMRKRGQKDFLSAAPDQQKALLDLIAFRKNETPELSPGIHFFEWARKMVVDAYYTSPAGIKDIGFLGNKAVAKFEVPQNVLAFIDAHGAK